MHIGPWPSILRPRSVNVRLAGQSVSGGRSLAGTTQTVVSNTGFWKVDLSAVVVKTAPELRAWRSVEGSLNGRSNTVDIPICDIARPFGLPADWTPFDDDTLFDDDTPFVDDPVATVWVPALLRATGLSIAKALPFWLEGGESFSIEHDEPYGNRLYRVAAVLDQAETIVAVTVTPPLRAAIPAGARVEFVRPLCRMRLAEDEGMAAELELKRLAQPSVAFVEDI